MKKRTLLIATVISLLMLSLAVVGAASAQSAQTDNPEPGLVIVRVDPDGPAAAAGVKRGDILLAADDTEINSMMNWMTFIADRAAGDEVTLTVMHGDDERNLTVTLAEQNGRIYVGLQPYIDMMQDLDTMQRMPQMPEMAGALIAEVTADSPAAVAKLQVGDRIMAVDGKEVTADQDLATLIGSMKPGDRVTLTVQNNAGEERSVRVRLGENPDKADAAYLGVRYSLAPAFNMDDLPQFRGGAPFGNAPEVVEAEVIVQSVVPDTAAATAGLKEGDQIVAIDGEEVTDPATIVDTIAKLEPGDTISLTVQRQGEAKNLEIEAKLGEHPDKAGKAFLGVELAANMQAEQMFQFGPHGMNPNGGSQMPFGRGNFQFRLDPNQLPDQLQELFEHFNMPVTPDAQPFSGQNL